MSTRRWETEMERVGRRWLAVVSATAVVSTLGLVATPSAVAAGSMMVNTTSDDITTGNGVCSLREAVDAASAGDNSADCGPVLNGGTTTISLPAGTYVLSLHQQLTIDAGADIEITGANPNSPAQTVIEAGGHLGAGYSRVLEVAAGAKARLVGVTLTGGRTRDGIDGPTAHASGTRSEDGGGILNRGNLTLEHVRVVENRTGDGGNGATGAALAEDLRLYDGGSGGASGDGGGVYNAEGATLTVRSSTIADNLTGDGGDGGNGASGLAGYSSGWNGGGGASPGSGGGIYNRGTAMVTDTTVRNNHTGDGGTGGAGGPGIDGYHGGWGGDGGTASFSYAEFDGKLQYVVYRGGGGIWTGGVGTLDLQRSTIADNRTGAGGAGGTAGLDAGRAGGESDGGDGGSGGLGGGLLSIGLSATLTNVTIAGNSTGSGGRGGNGADPLDVAGTGRGGSGGYGGGIWSEGWRSSHHLELIHVTIAGNLLGATGPGGWPSNDANPPRDGRRGKGAGISTGGRDVGSSAIATLRNSLIADNGSSAAGDRNCDQGYYPTYIDIKDGGGNVGHADDSCPGSTAQAPLLGALQDNGGPTETILPAMGSSVIGAVPAASCTVHVDQRGYPRPGRGPNCDAGAVETGEAPAVTATATFLTARPNPAVPGRAVTYTATISPPPSSGSVAFTDGDIPIPGCAAVAIGADGQESCTVTYPVAGRHTIIAAYGGNSLFSPSSSAALAQVVRNASRPGPVNQPAVGHAASGAPKAKHRKVIVPITCAGQAGGSCTLRLTLSASVRGKARRSAARDLIPDSKRRLTLGATAATVRAGAHTRVAVNLNRRGRALLARKHRLKVVLTVVQVQGSTTTVVLRRRVTFKTAR